MYKQLTSQQRSQISALLTTGTPKKEIAVIVGAHISTIYREIKRNGGKRSYNWANAQQKCDSRKQRLHRRRTYTPDIRKDVHDMLKDDWSPKQIVGYLKRMNKAWVSHETIYQEIREDKEAGGSLWKHTRHSMKHRNRTLYANYTPIPGRTDISERPIEADGTRFGDWEMDLIVGPENKGAILTLTERLTNYSIAATLPNGKTADDVALTVCRLLLPFKNSLKTMTTDNGPEFASHHIITKRLGMPVFFAKPYHSWEKGAIENYNKLLRQYIPKRTDLRTISEKQLKVFQYKINNRPRAKLNFDTPKNAFFKFF